MLVDSTRLRMWLGRTLLLLAAGASAAAAAQAPGDPDLARVVARFRIDAPDRFADGLASLYDAVGFGNLVDADRIRERIWADFPLTDLDGVDPRRPVGHLLVWSEEGLERVPFCGVRHLARVEATLAGSAWQVCHRGGVVYFVARPSLLAALDRTGESGGWDSAPALELDLDVAAIRAVGGESVHRFVAMLRGLARVADLLGRDPAVPRRGARWLEVGFRALSEWRSFGFAFWLEPERVRIRGRLEPEQGSAAASAIADARPLSPNGTALRPAAAPVWVELNNSPTAVVRLGSELAGWEEDALVRRIVEASTGELGVAVSADGSARLVASVDATTIRSRLRELDLDRPESAVTGDLRISGRRLGGWLEVSFGTSPPERRELETTDRVLGTEAREAGPPPVLRFGASIPVAIHLVRAAWTNDHGGLAPATESSLTGSATVDRSAMLIECELPWKHVCESIPRWR